MTSFLASLSPTQLAVTRLIYRHGQITAGQLRRAVYAGTGTGSAEGISVRSCRHLKALSERGVIRRLDYKLSGHQRGSGEYVYAPPDSKARIPNLHTLDVAELRVRLHEAGAPALAFTPEPWCHDTWGGVKLKPDAYVAVGRWRYFAEVDRGTEYASALSGQMNDYVRAFRGMDGGAFPQVLFLAHDVDRVRFIQREIDKKRVPGLIKVKLFSEAVGVMTGAQAGSSS
jgi:hypothetical protein